MKRTEADFLCECHNANETQVLFKNNIPATEFDGRGITAHIHYFLIKVKVKVKLEDKEWTLLVNL